MLHYASDFDTITTCIKLADKALYSAKMKRNNVVKIINLETDVF